MINYRLKLDCQGDKVLSSDMVFVSGDVKAYKLIFEFRDGGNEVDASDCILMVRARRADGSCVEGAGEIVEGKGIYIPQNSIYAIPGEVRLEIALCDSAKSYITTKIIVAEVIEGIGNSCEPERDEVSVFVSLATQLQAKMDEVKKLAKDAVPVKGEDYWTQEDKAEIVGEVKEQVGPFVITFDEDLVGDKTYEEIVEAINANKTIIANIYHEDLLSYKAYAVTATVYNEGVSLYTMLENSFIVAYCTSNNEWNVMVRDFATTMYVDEKVENGLRDKVDKVEGKNLSTNDFTDADKEKLNQLPTKAENDEIYATKESIGDIETALLEIEAMADDLIGGDAE